MLIMSIRVRSVNNTTFKYINEEWLAEIVYCWIGCGMNFSKERRKKKEKNEKNIKRCKSVS